MSGDCGNREERLVSLLYEDGDPAQLAEIRAHLATCATCRDELERLTETRELLGAWPDVVNAPRMVFVSGPEESNGGRVRARRRGWAGFGSFLPSLAAAAVVVLLLAASAPFLHIQVAADGKLHVGFGPSAASASDPSALATRGDLDQGLQKTAEYLEALVRAGRDQDRQAMLAVVDQTVREQNASMGEQVTNAINSAFDEMDRRRRADLGVMLSSMNDLQVITGTELQRINAMLASLAPAPRDGQE